MTLDRRRAAFGQRRAGGRIRQRYGVQARVGRSRVRRALELAAALLQRQGWTPEKIEQAVASGRSETIPLERAVPVLIVYWTVSVGASGGLRFARDVYTRDPPLIRALNAR